MINTLEPPTTAEGKKIEYIPATKSLHPEKDGVAPIRLKKRVAAYCRVSTTLEEQQGSYERQRDYYTKMIQDKPSWELAGIYGDEGKSGTTLKGRTGFLEMMDDVRAGRIDYIITKATSRFGRNTTEFIQILDELESYGVEVLFESEGIVTSGRQDRAMLQFMGIANEQYSSSLSTSIRWSKERNLRKGIVTICYKNFLGYEKGPDGKPKIVEEEAKTVRLIYQLFLEGKSYTYIANYLMEQNIPTPTGKGIWRGTTIKSILTNEKYTGDALLQKTFRRDFLDKQVHKNRGERPQVRVENNHDAIIDKATFARAQQLVEKRKHSRDSGTNNNPFTKKLICGDCNEYFGHKTWTSRGNIKYSMWVCNHKYSEETTYGGKKCKAANLRQEWIEQGYIYTMNQLLADREAFVAKYERKLARITRRLESGDIEKKLKALDDDLITIKDQDKELEAQSEFTFSRKDELMLKRQDLRLKMQQTLADISNLEAERLNLNSQKRLIEKFISITKSFPDKLTKFQPKVFQNMIDYIEVGQYILTYHLYGGEGVKVNVELLKQLCQQ